MNSIEIDSTYHVFSKVIRYHYILLHSLLDEMGMYPGQSKMLYVLEHSGDGQSQKELSEKLKIAPATLTVMLKRMENAGHIYRKQDEKDQRISRVYTTDEGKRISGESVKVLNKVNEICFKDFTKEELEELNRLHLKMQENLKKSLKNE